MRKIILGVLFGLSVTAGVAFAVGAPAPGTWYRQGSVTLGAGLHFTDIANALTALAGGAQAATATSTLAEVSEFTTVASGNDSATLPTPVSPYGRTRFIFNSASTNAMKIFAVTPTTVNGITTATGYALAAGKGALCVELSATNWGCVGP